MTEATVKLKKDICRCCYTEGIFNNLDVPIVVNGKRELYSDMLDKCLNITLQSTSGLTSMTLTICDLCIHRLIDACKFKIQVLACETKLQQLINESNKVSDKNSLGNNIEVKEEFVNFFEDDLFEEYSVEITECGDYADEHIQDPPEDVPELLAEENETQIETENIQENVEEMQNEEETHNEQEIHNVTKDDEKRQLLAEIESTRENLRRTLGAQRSTTNALEACSTIEIVDFDDAEKLMKLCGDEEKVAINNVQNRELHEYYPIKEIQKNRTNLSEIYSCTNATPIRKYGGIGYACCFCTEQFPEASDLKSHTRELHPKIEKSEYMKKMHVFRFSIKLDITDLKCSLCGIAINTIEDALLHLLNKHSRPVYTDIKNYIMPFKFNSDLFRCCICENISNNFKRLLEHMNEHYRNFICNVCNAGFVNRMKLENHSERHKVGCFKCDQCPKEFNTERKRKAHIVQVHSNGGLTIKCGYCPEKFKDYRKKHEHLRQVHGISSSPIKCQACDKTFLEQRYLSRHVKRDHLRERRYLCTECDMKFFLPAQLKTHMVKHTKLREFTCAVCLKSYARKNTLNNHMRLHDDHGRFECAHCGRSYVSKCRLIKHMRSKHLELV